MFASDVTLVVGVYSGHMVVVKMDGVAELCKTDEVGELCLAAPYVGQGYWGLEGITNNQFKVSSRRCKLVSS